MSKSTYTRRKKKKKETNRFSVLVHFLSLWPIQAICVRNVHHNIVCNYREHLKEKLITNCAEFRKNCRAISSCCHRRGEEKTEILSKVFAVRAWNRNSFFWKKIVWVCRRRTQMNVLTDIAYEFLANCLRHVFFLVFFVVFVAFIIRVMRNRDTRRNF